MRFVQLFWVGLILSWFGQGPALGSPVMRVVSSSGSTNFIRNGAFEDGLSRQPRFWSAAPQGVTLDAAGGRGGSQALLCQLTNASDWRGASQTLVLNRTHAAPVSVRGWSRAENVSGTPDSDYSLYVDVIYQDGTPLWGQTGNFRVGTHDWEAREFVIVPEKPIRSLTLHCLLRNHTGNAWFDDVQVEEISAPSGSVLFQGTPMTIVSDTNQPAGIGAASATDDGLRLAWVGSRVTGVRIGDRELTSSTSSGFLARDVAANSDLYDFVDGDCAELQLHLDWTVVPHADYLDVFGRIRSLVGGDRAVLLVFALPLDATGWQWHDDVEQRRVVEGRAELSRTAAVPSGTVNQLSIYPVACVSDGQSGMAMGIHPEHPAQYRVVYHAGTKQCLLAYDFGLVEETEKAPSSAEFRFVLFRTDPAWGFRSAIAKWMSLFPGRTQVRSKEQGIWMPFTDVSTVAGWRDFGFRYHEGDNNVGFDDRNGILSFRYQEPMTWWMPMATNLARDTATALRVRDEWAHGSAGFHQRMAALSDATVMHDPQGQPAMLFRNEPWANGAVWSLNPSPFLPASPNAATVYWNAAVREQNYGAQATVHLDGEYLDSIEGYVTADLNYRRDHFRYATVPLTFSLDTRRPAIGKGLAVFEFTRWLSDDLHRLGKLCFANGVPYRFGFLCPLLDVMGTETDWLSGGGYQPASHAQMRQWRALAGGKPYLLLMNTDFDRFGTDYVRRYFERSLFYGMFPSMFSHNAAENPYWQNPRWYERDRALFRRYIPLIRQVAEAGWQPVTQARCNPPVLLERFGPSADGSTYYTLWNDTPAAITTVLAETAESRPNEGKRVTTELLTSTLLPEQARSWRVTVPAEGVAVVRVEAGARFLAAGLDPSGRIRFSVTAPVGSVQVLEATEDLERWTPLSTNTMYASPATLEAGEAGGTARYFRLRR